MTYWRVYGTGGVRAGVIGVPTAIQGKSQQQRLWLPNSREFAKLWDKANDRPVVLDEKIDPGVL